MEDNLSDREGEINNCYDISTHKYEGNDFKVLKFKEKYEYPNYKDVDEESIKDSIFNFTAYSSVPLIANPI